jgi:hypothetical protein
MKYKQIHVEGRPIFDESESRESTYMKIEDASRPSDQSIWWNNDVLDRRRMDSTKRYQFNLLEGKCVDTEGRKVKYTHVWRVYDQERLIYDASYCRVHKRTMVRESYKSDIDVVSLPSGYDSVYDRLFPNSALDHPACSSRSSYTSLNWICPDCTEAEKQWLEKHSKVKRKQR